MINADEPGIAKVMLCLWLFNVARSSQHDKITMVTTRIKNILVTTNIISGIVYTKDFVSEYAAVFEQYLIDRRLGSGT